MIICIGYEGTVAERGSNTILPRTRHALTMLKNAGHTLIVHIHNHEKAVDIIEKIGKELPQLFTSYKAGERPEADLYIDRRNLRYDPGCAMGGFTWSQIEGLYGEKE